jgi:hypothetical protein
MVRLFYRDSLWSLIASPTIWAAHFLFCYMTAAIYCAKAPYPAANFATIRVVIGVVTVMALIAIAIAGFQAADDWRRALNAEWAADADSLEIRRRFVGRAAFLLSGLSGIAVLYVGMNALFISSCR